MKHFLRIAITLVVLCAIGLSCYFIFFKPDSDLETFTSLSDTIKYRENKGVDSKLNTLFSADKYGTNREYCYEVYEVTGEDTAKADFTIGEKAYKYTMKNGQKIAVRNDNNADFAFPMAGENFESINSYRDTLFAYGNVDSLSKAQHIEGTSRYSYMVIEKSLDEVFDYYFAYAQVLKNVKNSSQKSMNKAIKQYNSSLKQLNNQLKNVINYQLTYQPELTNTTPERTIKDSNNLKYVVEKHPKEHYDLDSNLSGRAELTDRYYELIRVYRNTLSKYCNVIDKLKDLVTKYVFGGELIIEAKTVKLDLTLETVRIALTTQGDESVVSDRINSKLNSASIFISGQIGKLSTVEAGDDTLLSNYNNVVKNAKEYLIKALKLSDAEMNTLADGASDTLKSQFSEKYLPDIIDILKVYGYGTNGGV